MDKHNALSKLVKDSLTAIGEKASVSQKSELIKHKNNYIVPTRGQVKIILSYLYSIGATDYHLTENDEANKQVLIQWYNEMVVKNTSFPSDINIGFVLEEFKSAVIQGYADMKGFNLRSQVQAFKQWIREYNNELYSKWYSLNADKKPKELPRFAGAEKTVDNVDNQLHTIFGDSIPQTFTKYTTKTKQL